jgi:hypothetical protein
MAGAMQSGGPGCLSGEGNRERLIRGRAVDPEASATAKRWAVGLVDRGDWRGRTERGGD